MKCFRCLEIIDALLGWGSYVALEPLWHVVVLCPKCWAHRKRVSAKQRYRRKQRELREQV